ncbi:MAG TPA: acetamidase/formamidase family protein [Solirubrobacteraceae bacterium]|jgi:amidase|nr:acetamidase/formamidase family protein [Solirubrobacteraceae bacterium]
MGTTVTPEPIRVSRSAKVFSYSAEHAPAVTVSPGETLIVETTSAFGEFGLGPGDDLSGLEIGRCDPLTGPIAVRGAQAGDVLEVHIDEIRVEGLGAQGVIPGIGILDWPRLPLEFHPVEDGEIVFPGGLRLRVRPNLGCLGVAPAGEAVPSVLPGDHGGNMDTRFVCAGSVVEFPVFHSGGLLFLGDCHQLQGDGELCGVAPETDAVVTLRCELRRGTGRLRRPRIRTDRRLMFIGSAATLEEAGALATADLVEALVADKGIDEDLAYLLVTVKADLEVCQVVNGLRTARVCIDREFYDGLPDA